MYFYCYVMCSFVILCILIVMYVIFCVSCFIVLFCVLFVCKWVLDYCHRVSSQLQLINISCIKQCSRQLHGQISFMIITAHSTANYKLCVCVCVCVWIPLTCTSVGGKEWSSIVIVKPTWCTFIQFIKN
jgi:hypothetical protein